MRDSDPAWLIRPCRPDEAPAVLELWRQAGASVSVTDTELVSGQQCRA
jgi:hypothetical protein